MSTTYPLTKTSSINIKPSSASLVVTTGEPAGIGMDILLQLAMQQKLGELSYPLIVLADESALQQRFELIYGSGVSKLSGPLWQRIESVNDLQQISGQTKGNALPQFYLLHVGCAEPVVAGQLNVNNAAMVVQQLQIAHQWAASGATSAIVTGPLQKSVLIDAGITLEDGGMFTGHTEFFMQKSGCQKVVMMLANSAMKVALVTIHMPLRQVADAITADNVRQTVRIVLNDLRQKFGLPNPKILVCGLNPHAGEDGHLGTEEMDIINPVLREFQQQGANISLAMPADTLFTTRHLQDCDALIAMYHDQGLPVLKSHGFGDTVNLTLGLPYIRTSVDHGTALDLAGNSATSDVQPSSSSLWQALIMAEAMVHSQQK